MLKETLYLLCFFLITFTTEAAERFVSVREVIDVIPKGWEYSEEYQQTGHPSLFDSRLSLY